MHYNKQGKYFSDNFRTNEVLLSLKLIYNHTCWLELDISFLNRKIIDQNFITIGINTQKY